MIVTQDSILKIRTRKIPEILSEYDRERKMAASRVMKAAHRISTLRTEKVTERQQKHASNKKGTQYGHLSG